MVFATNDDVDRILAQVDQRDPLGVRDYCLLVLARNTGLRVGELVGLDVHDVADGREVRTSLYVRPAIAKGGRPRRLPLNARAREAVFRLLAFNRARGFCTEIEAPLFATKKHGRMTVRAVQRLVAELRERARLAVPVTPHSFRHNYATRITEVSNIRVTQKLLGHKRLNTCQIYTHPGHGRAVDRLA